MINSPLNTSNRIKRQESSGIKCFALSLVKRLFGRIVQIRKVCMYYNMLYWKTHKGKENQTVKAVDEDRQSEHIILACVLCAYVGTLLHVQPPLVEIVGTK